MKEMKIDEENIENVIEMLFSLISPCMTSSKEKSTKNKLT